MILFILIILNHLFLVIFLGLNETQDELELRHEDIYYNNKDIVDRIIYQTCPLYDTTPFFDHTYDEKSKLDETKNPLRKHKDSALAA